MVCCVTGHRPKGFPFPREKENSGFDQYTKKLLSTIEALIEEGYDHFISGMAEGADLDFVECVIALRDRGYPITLEAALPYPISPRKHATQSTQNRRENLLLKCDCIVTVSPCYFRGCMQKRNRYMVDHADIVLAIWNGDRHGGTWNTIDYASTHKKPIRYIHLSNQ